MFSSRRFLVLLLALSMTLPSLLAVRTLKMNLADLSQRSHGIFRGVVLDITEDTIEVGGGALPVITYRIQVEEDFKGDFYLREGQRIAEVTMLAADKGGRAGSLQRLPAGLAMPTLRVGQEYLLFTTQPSAIGLSTTIGLGQGCFSLSQQDKVEVAVNEFGNQGLFDGMGVPDSGPLSYQRLAQLIRQHLR